MTETELIPREAPSGRGRSVRPQMTPTDMLMKAISEGVDLDRLEKLMALQERWEKGEARKAYVRAMAEFKRNAPEIIKDVHVSFLNNKNQIVEYDHPSIGEVVSKIAAAMAPHGIHHSWTPSQEEYPLIRVRCTITHEAGHSESVELRGPADDSGSKSPLQAIASTITLLERYTLLAITGMAAMNQDQADGNPNAGRPSEPERQSAKATNTEAPRASSEQSTSINEEQLKTLNKQLDKYGVPERHVLMKYNLASLEELPFSKLNLALAYIKSLNAEPQG